MPQGFWLVIVSVIAVAALPIGFFLHKWFTDRRLGAAADRAQRIVGEAQRAAGNLKKASELEMRDASLKSRAAFDAESRLRAREIEQVEQRVPAEHEQHGRTPAD